MEQCRLLQLLYVPVKMQLHAKKSSCITSLSETAPCLTVCKALQS